MPAYEVEHICPLSSAQCDAIAQAITRIHCTTFSAPSIFVNVRFTDISQQRTYVAGVPHKSNRIFANIRPSPNRTRAMCNELCKDLVDAWSKVVEGPASLTSNGDSSAGKHDTELRTIFVLGSIVAGREAGMELPEAGEEGQWVKRYEEWIKKKAAEGEVGFAELEGKLHD